MNAGHWGLQQWHNKSENIHPVSQDGFQPRIILYRVNMHISANSDILFINILIQTQMQG